MRAAADTEVAAPAQAEGRSVVRRVLFWTHLSAGAVAGLVIGLLSLTGAALALERPVLAWLTLRSAEAAAPWLPIDELLSRARAARPGVAPTAVTLNADAGTAWVALGRSGGVGLDGHTGALQGGSAPAVRETFRKIEELHRWLLLSGDARETGEGIVGACTLLFLFLALTGPFLWIPKRWSTVATRRISWFRSGLRGRARDWNWHHVLGIWCFPVLVVLSASGVVMSYRWANDAVFRLAGSPPPPPGRPQGPKMEPPGDGAAALPLQCIADLAMERVPTWRELTVRLDPQAGRKPAPVQLTVRQRDARPRFAAVQLWADPFTGKFLREERYNDLSPGRKARVWMRFLHTAEAFGGAGQLVAGLASLGAAVLVWTGLALAVRRLARSLRARPAIGSEAEPSSP
jgi:uncharacterized iron-regulated membrane protein